MPLRNRRTKNEISVKGENNIMGIPVVTEYKYLGITLTYTLSIEKYID